MRPRRPVAAFVVDMPSPCRRFCPHCAHHAIDAPFLPLPRHHSAVAPVSAAQRPLGDGKRRGQRQWIMMPTGQIWSKGKVRAEEVAVTLCNMHIQDAHVWAEEVAPDEEAPQAEEAVRTDLRKDDVSPRTATNSMFGMGGRGCWQAWARTVDGSGVKSGHGGGSARAKPWSRPRRALATAVTPQHLLLLYRRCVAVAPPLLPPSRSSCLPLSHHPLSLPPLSHRHNAFALAAILPPPRGNGRKQGQRW